MTHNSCIVYTPPPFLSSTGSHRHVLFSRSSSKMQNPERQKELKEIQPKNHGSTTSIATTLVFFLFLFQSSSQTAIFCFFFTLKTQPCTIQSSKGLLLQPQLKIVYPKPHFPVTHLSFFKDGERPAEVCQMDQQFYKARQ